MQELLTDFTEDGIGMTNKHVIMLIIREMQIKTSMRYHYR